MNSNYGELNDIFIERKSAPKKLIPIINSSIKIPNLISYLNDAKNNFKNKIKLIEQLTPLFKSNENILLLFIEKGTINNSPNLFHILINLYLDKNAQKVDLTILEDFINIILYNISIPKTAIEYIYLNFSKFYESEENINFCRCLRILNIFYGSDISKKSDKYIKNYFYFNGKNSSLNFNINKNSKNLNSDFPTIEYGFTFIFWLFLTKDLIQDYFAYFPSIIINLININIKEHNIQLILKNINTIIISLNNEEIGNIDLNKTQFKYDDWNFISFYLTQEIKGKQNPCLKLIINDNKELIKIQLNDDFPLNEKINAINLFENLLGKVSSVLFFSFCVDMELVDFLKNNYKRGFYKNKYLFHFLYMNDNDYFKNVRNYKYCIKYKKDKNPLNLLNIVNSSSQTQKNIISFLCPFASRKNSKIIDDIFGNFFGILNQDDGIIKYKNNIKYIDNLGGLNNILPLGELIFLNNKNILTKESFKEFITLLKTIFHNNLNTLSQAYALNFFSTLALFLERIDKNFFEEKILEIFLLLGKEELNFSKDNIIFDNIEEENEKDNFIRDILLNIKLIKKFDIYKQIQLWDNLYLFLKSDYYQIKAAFNIPKINIILRYYDENKFSEYCCSYHANLFISNNNQIMNPDLEKKTEKIFGIIQLYLDKLTHEDEDDTNLFKLLCLDFSPCIQKKIICLYIEHFSNEKILQDMKIKTAKNLIKNNFLDILEYIFSISLIDIKIELVKMLSIMMKYISNNSYFNKKIPTEMIDIISFIGDNILPEQLITKINPDNNNNIINININNNKKTQFELLSNYYNKKEYEIKIEELWSLLKSFMFKIQEKENTNEEKKEKKLEMNEIFINLMRYFVTRNIITEHIYEFIQIMQRFLKRKDIRNIYILYEKDFLYFWLIKTIFYFNIRENTKDNSKNNLYENIKNCSLDLLQELFKRSEGKEKFNRIRYVLYYAYRLKLILNKNISCINDIEITIRKLLSIFLENKKMNLNYEQLTILSYEFILFFKSSDKYLEENTNQNTQRNDIIENLSKRKLTKSLFVFSNPEMNINNSDDDLLNINYDKMIEEKEVIPECIYEGFCYDNKNDIINNDEKNWVDFPICEKIIKYYSSKFWGLDKICLNINEDPKKKNNELYLKLIKEYTENKNYKNILYNELSQLLNLNDNNKKNSLNILSINAQLLSIAYSLSHENNELDKIEEYLIHLIIYCILSSLNINPTEKEFAKIQEHLYNILGFLFLLIQYQNSNLYREIINKYISPIFSKIYSTLNKKSFFNIFNKKNIYSNSALFILFEYVPKSQSNNINTKHRRYTTFTSNLELGKAISNDNFVIINDDYKINFSQNGSVTMKLTDENKKEILKYFFQRSFIYYKNQRNRMSNKINIIKLSFNYNKLIKEDEIILINETKERNRVNKSIINLITSLENNLKKYFNIILLTDKKRRNNYKSIKKKLFSFCGFWSNKKIFYENPSILKLKKANFLSQEMTQFLLKPILDIEYELPNFKKFEKKNLFNKKNISYKINLNIDEILQKGKNINENDIKIVINKSKKNFIESIYKYSYNKIWDKYNSYNKQNVYKENISLNNRVTYDVLISNKFRTNNNEKNKYENIYFCCLIKQTHHICGYISTEKNKIIFLYDSEESNDYIKDDYGFDTEMNCCFGSIFRKHQKDKDIINFYIKYDEIKYMFYKIYFYNLSAIEIYTVSNKSFLFNFKNNKNLSQFINDILNHAKFQEIKLSENSSKILGFCHIANTPVSLTSKKNWNIFLNIKYEDWRKHKISTLELLMWLNILSGRSFQDMTQYPVFPWVITNFQTDELNLSENIRNMTLPIGMLNTSKESRRETFIEIYNSVKSDLNEIDPGFKYQNYLSKGNEYYDAYIQNKLKLKKSNNEINIIQPNQLPYFYGTHYSNATYVSHYLTRIFPFAFISIEIQGEKFDDKDRLFTSMQKTFESAMSLKDDVRELIPEFFYLPEMFLNLNNLNFNQDEEINNIQLPPWAKGSVYYFVSQLRSILEKDNLNINEWLDLIFGFKQRGEKAELANNIYMGTSYQSIVNVENFKDSDVRNTLMRLVEVGITPNQLFEIKCKEKYDKDFILTKNPKYSLSKGEFIYESDTLITKYIKSIKYNEIFERFCCNNKNKNNELKILPKILKIKYIEKDIINIFTNCDLFFTIKISSINDNIEESEINEIENQSSKFTPSYLISDIIPPVLISNDNKYFFKGGFWDGRVEISSINKDIEKYFNCFYPNIDDPVINMKISLDDKFLLCGTLNGILVVIKIINKNKNLFFHTYKKIYDHNDIITSIFICDKLNICATCSKDGNILLYTMPKFKLVRCIKIFLDNNKNENIYADNIFLSSTPIPCISVYISSKKIFKNYSINGLPINEVKEIDNTSYITSSKVIHDLNFQEYLIYGTNDAFIKIRKFPELNLINSIEFINKNPIEAFDISLDHRFCFVYNTQENFAFFYEPNAAKIENSNVKEKKQK